MFYNASTVSFDQVLGRYESYECSPTASDGGYRSVATQSSFSQSGPVYFKSAGGCSAARFLDDAVDEVRLAQPLQARHVQRNWARGGVGGERFEMQRIQR